jgi:hypothetical protein
MLPTRADKTERRESFAAMRKLDLYYGTVKSATDGQHFMARTDRIALSDGPGDLERYRHQSSGTPAQKSVIRVIVRISRFIVL